MNKHLNQPEAFLFDLDGTLINTAPDFIFCINALRQKYQLPTLENNPEIQAKISEGSLALVHVALDELSLSDHIIQQERNFFLEIYQQISGQLGQFFPDVLPLIEHLNQKQIPWGIVTNKPERFARPLLNKLQLDVACLIGPESVGRPKPSPEGVLLAATRLKIDPQRTWFIGDHENDLLAARGAKMTAVLANYGYINAQAKQWDCDLAIDDLASLLEFVK
jgi:2-phosphoglycolate phosphatase